jgi:hypothetical protein
MFETVIVVKNLYWQGDSYKDEVARKILKRIRATLSRNRCNDFCQQIRLAD